MTSFKSVETLEAAEERLEAMKWTLVRPSSRSKVHKTIKKGIIETTAGILGKGFPRGIIYENRLRKIWPDRLKRQGI